MPSLDLETNRERIPQQVRTQTTRRKLLRSAEHIFARDGFEAASIEDIAEAAGYSRGAFYANFKSKEDLFMALLEDFVRRRVADVESLMERANSPKEQAELLRDYYAHIAIQRQWALIFLEYKLFAARHPKARARLQQRLRGLRAGGAQILHRLSTALGHRTPVSSMTAAVAMGALSNALLLEQLVDPKIFSPHDIHTLLSLFFDSLTGEDPLLGRRW
jgi:AcrR family transcriptional regulator